MDWILNLSFVVGVGATLIGLGALFFPEKSAAGFGIKVHGDGLAFVRVSGARDLFIGALFFYFFSRHDAHEIAILCVFTAFVSGSDFFITRAYGSKTISYFHLFATVAALSYSAFLFEKF
jgi:hypothetical protein